ncbi:MAG: AFG1 family ATPase [Thiotrichaceae bacterium]|nr:AFG1 family ATPase [Thiotrichaceae bacterium]
MSIKQHYQTTISQQGYQQDPEQENAIDHFQRLYRELLIPPKTTSFLPRVLNKTPSTTQGLYLWGGPGRGKTYLMDLFYHHLPTQQKQRIHFHQFMHNVHAELATIKSQQAPLAVIGQRIAEKTRILCLDEFYVADIGDAMLLTGLLEALFANQVVLVTTSNTKPDNLYRGGLQRERFLPAIALIQRHTQLVKMEQGDDYRLQTTSDTAFKRYQICDQASAQELMGQQFQHLSGGVFEERGISIKINGRELPVIATHDDLIWFSFNTLCETARAAADYLEIANRYQRLMITHIPVMDEALDNAAIRFIHLIDAIYDNKVALITTAAAIPQRLYTGSHHTNSFKRTSSRLCEMEHYDYSTR